MAKKIIESEKDYIESMLELKQQHISSDRTGVGTSKQFNRLFEFNIGDKTKPLPILIGKHTGLKTALVELVWIMKGRSDLKWLKDNGVHYWDKWVKEDGTFGPIYGEQMRNFALTGKDQLSDLVDSLQINVNSRRHIISLWDPTTLYKQSLPACHCFYHMTTEETPEAKIVNLHVTQRSGDSYLGIPYDLLMFMKFMEIVTFVVNHNLIVSNPDSKLIEVNKLFLTVNDYHLYSNHHKAIDKYSNEYAKNSEIYNPPTGIEFNDYIKSWSNELIDNGIELDIDMMLDKIVERNFNIFKYSIDNYIWTQPTNLLKINASVAV